jgi:hypothetical protein
MSPLSSVTLRQVNSSPFRSEVIYNNLWKDFLRNHLAVLAVMAISIGIGIALTGDVSAPHRGR